MEEIRRINEVLAKRQYVYVVISWVTKLDAKNKNNNPKEQRVIVLGTRSSKIALYVMRKFPYEETMVFSTYPGNYIKKTKKLILDGNYIWAADRLDLNDCLRLLEVSPF